MSPRLQKRGAIIRSRGGSRARPGPHGPASIAATSTSIGLSDDDSAVTKPGCSSVIAEGGRSRMFGAKLCRSTVNHISEYGDVNQPAITLATPITALRRLAGG